MDFEIIDKKCGVQTRLHNVRKYWISLVNRDFSETNEGRQDVKSWWEALSESAINERIISISIFKLTVF